MSKKEPMKKEIVNLSDIPLEDLKPYPNNAKIHTAEQIEHIAESIKKFGVVQPIVVDSENVIVIGHGRWQAMKIIGIKSSPVVMLRGYSEEEIRALRIADNSINAETSFDFAILEQELSFLVQANFDLPALGLDDLVPNEPEASGGSSRVNAKNFSDWVVIIECDDERQQQALFERFTRENLKCKIIA